MKKSSLIISVVLLTILFFPANTAAETRLQPISINASAAIMIDAKSGKVLYEKNADEIIPPASMTKLMTIHIALEYINSGKYSADDIVPISKNADFRSLPPHSSLMFLEQGQRVSLIKLLQGLALPSGNDAAIAVAEYIAGSVEDFVQLMNNKAEALNLSNTHFDDSSGLSEKNLTTAREYASFCRIYIEKNKAYLKKLHTPADFTYPKAANIPIGGDSVYGPITQPNHNLLIGRMPGVDGLKTGFIEESGYNFAATAEKDGRRLILVMMGGPGTTANEGSLRRALDAARLLTYGFFGWIEYRHPVPKSGKVEVGGGKSRYLKITYSIPDPILIEASKVDELSFHSRFDDIKPPVKAGDLIGSWHITDGENNLLQNGTISAAIDMKKGNILQRVLDYFRRK